MKTRKPIRGGQEKRTGCEAHVGSEEFRTYVGETAAGRGSRDATGNGEQGEVIESKEHML